MNPTSHWLPKEPIDHNSTISPPTYFPSLTSLPPPTNIEGAVYALINFVTYAAKPTHYPPLLKSPKTGPGISMVPGYLTRRKFYRNYKKTLLNRNEPVKKPERCSPASTTLFPHPLCKWTSRNYRTSLRFTPLLNSSRIHQLFPIHSLNTRHSFHLSLRKLSLRYYFLTLKLQTEALYICFHTNDSSLLYNLLIFLPELGTGIHKNLRHSAPGPNEIKQPNSLSYTFSPYSSQH